MTRSWPLLWINVALDWGGVWLAVFLAAQLIDQHPALGVQAVGLVFGLGFLLVAWFLGGYSYWRWPWLSCRQLLQRWLLVVTCALVLAVLAGWPLHADLAKLWFDRNTLLMAGLVLVAWGSLTRLCLLPIARRASAQRISRSPLVSRSTNLETAQHQVVDRPQRQLLLLFVAYHPSTSEVQRLQSCLAELPPEVGYAVVVNDHSPGEPIEQLQAGADCFLFNRDNPGYGRAVNRLVVRLGALPPYIGVLNTDLSWPPGAFKQLLSWLQQHPQVSLAVPQVLDEAGIPQQLCKQHPTVLGLFSRRFLPPGLKPQWLKRYDRWYVMADQNYQEVFEAPYLSGCCMLIRSDAFRSAGGFDERYFLYLEDADLTRSLARNGRCVHLPVAGVVHGWGRGNYRKLGLMLVNLVSAWHYFRKWGWALW